MNRALLCIFLLSFLNQPNAQEIYVSPTGDDNNSGSQSAPFKTLALALSLTSSGTIYLLEGSYKQATVISGKNGTEENPIVISAYPDHQVIFDGTHDASV